MVSNVLPCIQNIFKNDLVVHAEGIQMFPYIQPSLRPGACPFSGGIDTRYFLISLFSGVGAVTCSILLMQINCDVGIEPELNIMNAYERSAQRTIVG